MQRLGETKQFKTRQNIVLEGFDPVSAGGFTQVPNFLFNDKRLSLAARFIYGKLLSYAWNNDQVFPGQETMAREIGMSKRALVTAMSKLEKVGYLSVKRRGLGKTNVYTLHHTVKPRKVV